ncbi:MAG: hypothetical protein RLZZ188_3439 [Verrucomicrobiota bacterium]|jgi:hypothetical protein
MTKVKITREEFTVPAVTETAVASNNTSVAVLDRPSEADRYDDITRDVIVPILGLINKVGKLAEKFENRAGNFALGDELLGQSVAVIPVSLMKLVEEVAFNGKPLVYGESVPKVFSSAMEAYSAGYVVDKTRLAPNRVEEIAKVGYLVIAPPGNTSSDFMLEIDGLRLQPAQCTYRRSAFARVYYPLFNHAHGICLGRGIEYRGLNASQVFAKAKAWTHQWTLHSKLEKNAKNSWWEPRISKGDELSAAIQSWIEKNYGAFGA